MSKQTESNLFIVSSLPGLYQHLLSGVASYEELGNRVLRQIKAAHAFRQVEQVRELARILVNIPIKEYQLIGRYYLVWCQFRECNCNDKILESVIEQTQTHKSKALISRAAFEVYRGSSETALHFYTEALRAQPTASEYLAASRGIALAKSMEGFHGSALKDLERLLPLLRYAEPLTYYDVINSYAVELIEHNRLSEAHHASLVVTSSPFGPFYPEWQDTLSEVRSNRKQRSTVAIARPQIEQEYEAESEARENALHKARVQTVIDFMSVNLHRKVALTELAEVVHLSPSHLSHLFKIQTALSPGEYLIGLRMEKAHELLITRFESIKEIMAMVGYGNRSNFVRHFRRYFGFAPAEYRKRTFSGV